MIDVRQLTGGELDAALEEVARLRIAVFRAWPYLYDGDLGYERAYLEAYRASDRAAVIGAFDGDRLIGASTGMPLVDHADDFGAAFRESGIDMTTVFYCAESVLLPEYRGHGIGHRFFDLREAHALALGFKNVAFCGVVRPANHRLRPENARSLEPFWRGRDYAPVDGVVARFSWKDIDQTEESDKPLQFWMRAF